MTGRAPSALRVTVWNEAVHEAMWEPEYLPIKQ